MYLGIDLGTSGLRALLIEANGRAVADAQAEYSVQNPHSGWSEQDPNDWITAAKKSIKTLKDQYPKQFSALRGIGLSGQMHGAVLLDDAGEVLRPCILWNDTRAAKEAAALDRHAEMRDLSGNIVFPGFTAPKLQWVKTHEPEIFARIAKVLLPKDYLRFWLTGEYVSDMSDSAGTSWLDVQKRDWSDTLLSLSGMTEEQMPRLVEGSETSGHLRTDLQKQWGIDQPVVIAGGGGDNAVAACGVGCFNEGNGFVSLGTSGVLLAAKDNYAPNPASAVHTFCHAIPNTWYQMGVTLAATDCLNWLSRQTGQTPETLDAALPDTPSGPSSVTFLPYLSGERTPHNSASIRGSLLGLDIADTPATLTQAVMEGVAYSLADCLKSLESTGTNLTKLLAIGGGTQSAFWVKTLANILNTPIALPLKGEFGAALGAARLAIIADNPTAAISEVLSAPKIAQTIDPDPRYRSQYADSLAYYRTFYLKTIG